MGRDQTQPAPPKASSHCGGKRRDRLESCILLAAEHMSMLLECILYIHTFSLFPKDHWTLKTGYFEDPTPAIQVQTLPVEGPRSLGLVYKGLPPMPPTPQFRQEMAKAGWASDFSTSWVCWGSFVSLCVLMVLQWKSNLYFCFHNCQKKLAEYDSWKMFGSHHICFDCWKWNSCGVKVQIERTKMMQPQAKGFKPKPAKTIPRKTA